jgi:hypothetical protein
MGVFLVSHLVHDALHTSAQIHFGGYIQIHTSPLHAFFSKKGIRQGILETGKMVILGGWDYTLMKLR